MATKSSSPPPCEEQPSTKKAKLQEDPHQETVEEQPSIEKAKSEADQQQEQQEQTEEKPTPGEGDKVAPAEAPIKSEECTNTDSEPDLKLRGQLEYYFGDYNLRFDNYLKEQIVKGDGWVPVAEFLKFNRVLERTKDVAKLVEAIEVSQLLELSECKTKVRRSAPLPDEEAFMKSLSERTIHLKGFPLTSNFEDLQKFCDQYGELESLQMRRMFKTKQFKGCIHAVFKDAANVSKILSLDTLQYKDREILRESMEAYHKRKAERKQKFLEKKSEKKAAKA